MNTQGEHTCTAERPVLGGWLRCNRETSHTEPGHLDGRTGRPWGFPGEGCDWADGLSRTERRALRGQLARACKRFYDAAPPSIYRVRKKAAPVDGTALLECSSEMAALHLDVTERAAVATS